MLHDAKNALIAVKKFLYLKLAIAPIEHILPANLQIIRTKPARDNGFFHQDDWTTLNKK